MAGLRLYSDPLQHALLAAAVAAPLVPHAGGRAVAAAVAAALVIDVDHVVAARSVRIGALTSLPVRPWSHSLVTAVAAGTLVGVRAGPLLGWATAGGLTSHLLHDAGDAAAPTPLLWPFAPARQIGRRRQLAATAAIVGVSAALSAGAGAAAKRCAAPAGDGAAPRRRTA